MFAIDDSCAHQDAAIADGWLQLRAVSLRLPSGGGLRDAEGGLGAQTFEPVGELLMLPYSSPN